MSFRSSILGNRSAGDHSLGKKEYNTAIKYYDQALQKDPRDYKALKGKAKALKGLSKFKEAYDCFVQVLEINQIDSGAIKGKIETLLEMGYEALDNENFDKSIEYFKEVLEINHKDSNVLANLYSSPKNTEKIRGKVSEVFSGYMDELLGIKASDLEALRGIGWALFGQKEYEESINFFERVLINKSTDIGALKGKGSALSALDQNLLAVKCFDNILEIKHNDNDTLRLLGWTLIELKEFEKSLKNFNTLINFDVYDQDVIEGKCISLIGAADQNLQIQKYIPALGYYNDYLKEKPKNSWALIGKIEALWFISEDLINKMEFSEALKKIDDALSSSEVLLKSDNVPQEDIDNLKNIKN